MEAGLILKKINIKNIFNVISLFVPIGFIIYFFVSENGFIDLINYASKFNFFWLFLGLLFQILNIIVDGVILYKFVKSYDNNYSISKAFITSCVGQFYTAITPGGVGGQPVQIYSLTKQKINTGVSSACLIQKFLIYQTIITVYSLVSIIFNINMFFGGSKKLMIFLAILGFVSHAIVIIFIFMFSVNKKLTNNIINFCLNFLSKIKIIKNIDKTRNNITEQLEKFHESNINLYKNKKLLINISVLVILQLTFMFCIPYMIYRAFNFSGASIFDMITAQAIVTMISSFMPLPGGSGAAESSFYLFFSMFFTENTIKSAILVWRLITYFFNIIIFAPFANINKIQEKSRES